MTPRATIPRATMRLQFHKGFPFAAAEKIVPYMAGLGVSHLYASPIAAARAGSMHGYDVIDPTRVNPELGGEDALKRLVEALHRQGLGLIVDIVPNHMAASPENAWWADVLRHGQKSRYARWFDVDWESEDPELRGKVFLPVLDKPQHEARAAGELQAYEGQAVVPGWWRTANDRINWRRFFDINDLVCLRMKDEEAFQAVHALPARLYREGLIQGVRVDHVDGLTDPAGYCRKLRGLLTSDAYLVVEKILLKGEKLPTEWGCDGTTGYDFMDQVSALQHDPEAGLLLAEAWAALSGRPAAFAVEEEAARREIIGRSFTAPLDACVAAFDRLAKADPAASDVSRPALRRTLTELMAHFPVYRSYGAAPSPYIRAAVDGAKKTARPGDRWLLDLLQRWMTAPAKDNGVALARFQQLSAPVAAKSVEDTAFYRYGRLLSRNDVGFDLDRFGITADAFHALMGTRQKEMPHAMLATATHDHKRGEDVRARLAVLSERPRDWTVRLSRWIAESDGSLDAGDRAMLFQMIVGAWPLDLALDDAIGRGAFAERLAGWQEKALREAKLRSDWADPNQAYEKSAHKFLKELVADNAKPALLGDLFAFVQSIAYAGAVNGLAQTVLKLTVPGMPDLYQGTDYWDFSLVDPDNRRPVDFERRAQSLASIDLEDAMTHWRDGRIKQAVTQCLLALRRALPDLFAHGDYRPIAAAHALAFERRHGDARLVVVVQHLAAEPANLSGSTLRLPSGESLFGVFDGQRIESGDVALQQIFAALPVAAFSTKMP